MDRAGFGMRASFQPSYAVLKENSGIFKNKGRPISLSGTMSKTPDVEKFFLRLSIVETCYRLSLTLVDAQGGSVAEWLACWTQAQKGLGSNRSRDAVR